MACWLGFFALGTVGATAGKQFVVIGTGGANGVYYAAGRAVCDTVNKRSAAESSNPDTRCAAPVTGGSIYNIASIRTGTLDMGVVQSDWQHHAYHGTSKFSGQSYKKLRALFSLHSEPFHMLVGKGADIKNWADLAGKTVNIGNVGSGQRGTFEVLMMAHGTDASHFGKVTELDSGKHTDALCSGQIDAYGYTVGMPDAGAARAITDCGASIIDLNSEAEKGLIADNPFYASTIIPKDTYAIIDNDVHTFGVMATMVASTDMSEETAYEIVRAVFENIADLRKSHPAFANLKPDEMMKSGISAPLHRGAVKYYREKGWM
jgi:TRAP transporter TAXI family solute receptor